MPGTTLFGRVDAMSATIANYVGDLEQAFPSALAARSAAPSAGSNGRREIILFVVDARHSQWAQNFLLNLDEHGLGGRALAIGSSQEACEKLLKRVAAGKLTCGHSSYLRKGAGNSSIDDALGKWKIREWHVFHLWWQRWRYLAWAVELGYNAMSLDTDISLRSNPYALFHGALAHRNLIVGLDSEAGGKERPGLFPMINVGLVYCQRCAINGGGHRVLKEVSRRVHSFLFGPLLWKTKHGHTMIAERVLWEQDLFKDALEHTAFNLPSGESRHAAGNANPPEGGFVRDPTARERGWRIEAIGLAPGLPPQSSPWLPLHAASSSSPHVALAAGSSGGSVAATTAGADESATGLPLWIFSPWNVPPHGSACAGQWAFRPSPVMIGHLVGCTSKHLIMRQLGWWHYEVSAADMLAAKEEGRSAAAKAAAAKAATTQPQQPTPTRAFPPDARVLVLRHHNLRMRAPDDVHGVWDVLRRFSMLALALGRRAVLPLVPCGLSPCAPRVPNPLRPSLYTVTLGDPTACDEPPKPPEAGHGNARWDLSQPAPSTSVDALTQRPYMSPLGWAPSPNTSKWWWEPRWRGPKREERGCCQAIPSFASCIDPAGARRPLGVEPLLATADLGRFLEEIHKKDDLKGSAAQPLSPMIAMVATVRLSKEWGEDSLDELREASAAKVLVLDGVWEASTRLPSIDWLVQNGGAGAAAEEAIGAHAAKCFTQLGKPI